MFLFLRRPSAGRTCLLLALLAIAIRLSVLPFLYQEVLDPDRGHWNFGYEQGKVARSITLGQGFANPLFDETGPTAYPAPVYPYVLAGIFKIFGIYSKRSAIVAIALNCILSGLTVIPIFCIARRSFGHVTALVAAWVWIFFPYSVYGPIIRVWDTWLSTLLLAVLFLLALRLEFADDLWSWAGFGLLSGFTALTNPVAIFVMPGLTLWLMWRLQKRRKRSAGVIAVFTLCAAAVVMPWIFRNYIVFHRFIPVRDSLGLELAVGNDGHYKRLYDLRGGPWQAFKGEPDPEWDRYRTMGEIAYFDQRAKEGIAYVRSHPGEYVVNCLRRFVNIWTEFWTFSRFRTDPGFLVVVVLCTIFSLITLYGLRCAWTEGPRQCLPYMIVLGFYPMIYYFTHTADWYRRPIDPFLVIIAAEACVSMYYKRQEKKADAVVVKLRPIGVAARTIMDSEPNPQPGLTAAEGLEQA